MTIFGLDFGTTYSTISVLKDGSVYCYKQQDSPYIPTSVYMYHDHMTSVIGGDAELMVSTYPSGGSYFKDLKRWIGCSDDNFQDYIQKLKPHYTVTLGKFGSGSRKVPILHSFNRGGKLSLFLPSLIAAYVKILVELASAEFAVHCTGIICSVPAAYNSSQRVFTMESVNLSGYNCLHIINEPSAAAFSASTRLVPSDEFALVYDFGGGTFDVSGVSVRNNTFVVRASGGDMNLGGRDVDKAFADSLYSRVKFTPNYEEDLAPLKESLSLHGGSVRYTLTNESGESQELLVEPSDVSMVVVPFIERTVKIMTETYRKFLRSVAEDDAALSVSKQCVLIVVGGSSYLPGLKGVLKAIPFVNRIVDLPDPRSAVSAGCSLYSMCLAHDSPMLLVDCASHFLSIPGYNCEALPVVPAGAPIPFNGEKAISLMSAQANTVYTASLYEGDNTKTALNTLVYEGTVSLRSLGCTDLTPKKLDLIISTSVSSIGTVTFFVGLRGGKPVQIGGSSSFSFSSEKSPVRTTADLSTYSETRASVVLALTRTAESRKKLSDADKARLVVDTSPTEDLKTIVSRYNSFDDASTSFSELYMGKLVSKILRGTKIHQIPL
jgi:molecular chaperone DnaK (HSP70)